MRKSPLPMALLALAALIIPAHILTMAQTQTNDTLAVGASAPPVAKKIPHTTTVHGVTLRDDYFWMRDKKNPEVISYLEAENAYTAAVMKPTEALQGKLYKELLSRIKETDTNVPYRMGGYLYYTRTEQGKQYATFARRKGLMSATEEVLLDLNEMVKGHPFMSVIGVERTRSRGYIFITSGSHTTSEVRYVSADRPTDELKVIRPREAGHEYYAEHHGDRFYIRSNEGGRRNFRLVSAPTSDPRKENWKEVIPHRPGVMLDSVDFFKDFYVVSERGNATPVLRVVDIKTGKGVDIKVPEPVYTISLGANREFDTDKVRYNYQSFITPSSVYDYDVKTARSELLKQQPVLGGYDPTLYKSERVYATASDGTRVPVSLVYKKDLKLDGQRPLLLGGYGSYGVPSNVTFSSARLSLLDRGVVFATAHIRGGGDLGKEWHDAGKMMSKKNTFTDFIASAEYLIKAGYTSKDRLVITGGSAGGLLLGGGTTMRPHVFKTAVASHPLIVAYIHDNLDT